MPFAGGDGGGTLPFETDSADLDSRGQINKFRHAEYGYVDRVRASYVNDSDSSVDIEVAFAVPTGATIVERDLPAGATETTRAPQAVVANLPGEEFDRQNILGRQSAFDFYSFDISVPGRESIPDDAPVEASHSPGRVHPAFLVESPKGESKELGVWILGSFAGGSGTSSDPYLITDWTHLDSVRNNLTDSFELQNDLDSNTNGYSSLASSSANSGNGWVPIGTSSTPFTGTFDGLSNEIADFVINRGSEDHVGLFGVGDVATVLDLGVADADVTGNSDVAIILGFQGADFTRCYATGTVSASGHCGILHGVGTIVADRCFAAGSVSGSGDVGALNGWGFSGTDTDIDNSYSIASVEGGGRAGGLVGHGNSTDDSVLGGYAADSVTATASSPDVGGIGGDVEADGDFINPEYDNLYWDTESTGQSNAFGVVQNTTAGFLGTQTGLTTSEMQGSAATTNMSGLDFSSTWETVLSGDSDTNADGYPILQDLPREPQLEAQGVHQVPAGSVRSTSSGVVQTSSGVVQTVGSSGGGSAIPESEANQKLVHRWYLSEDSAPFVDQIGNADSTSVTGTTQVTGDYVDGAARDGDGTDDVIETTTWGSFGSNMDTDFAIAFSFKATATSGAFIGIQNPNDNTTVYADIGDLASGGEITFFIRDSNGNNISISTDNTYNDDIPHRVVLNKTGNTGSDLEIWIDGNQVATTVDSDQSFSSPTDFEVGVPIFSYDDSGTITRYFDGIQDDVCIFDNSLTQTEIESYTNPWS